MLPGERKGHLVPGDELIAFLKGRRPARDQVCVEPPPTSWGALKPALLAHLEALRSRGEPLPHFIQYPLCAIGAGGLDLPTITAPWRGAFSACDACAQRHRCSPPAAFHDELVPFSPASPALLWRRFHQRLCAALGVAPRPAFDRFVDAVTDALVGPLAGVALSIEPSISIADDLVPALRLAVFHHLPSLGPEAAMHAARQLVASFAGLHAIVGEPPPPPRLLEILLRHGPFPLPVGFDATAGRPVLVKCYVVVEQLPDDKKRALLLELLDLAGTPPDRVVAEMVFADLDMIGISTGDGVIDGIKIYQRRDPTRSWPAASLPALAASHPAVLMSGGKAYATVDVHAVAPRAPKWDVRVRDELLPGPVLVRRYGSSLSRPGAAALAGLLDHRDFRADTVAIAVRDRQTTFYVDLG